MQLFQASEQLLRLLKTSQRGETGNRSSTSAPCRQRHSALEQIQLLPALLQSGFRNVGNETVGAGIGSGTTK
jgi:hypothetical protein